MHAIFGVSEIEAGRVGEAEAMLKNALAPQIQQEPGFVSGTSGRSPDGKEARSVVVFETEEAARAVVASLTGRLPADAPVKVLSMSVLEVVLQV